MSICTTESLQSVRELDRIHNWQDRQAQAEADMAYEFERAIEQGDPDWTPYWTGTCPDNDAAKRLGITYGSPSYPRRAVTVEEAFRDSIDYPNGPDMRDIVRLVSMSIKSTDPIVSLAARQLVKRAASMFVKYNCPEVE